MEKLYYVSQNSGFAYTSLEKVKAGLREVIDNWVDQVTYPGDVGDLSPKDTLHWEDLLSQIDVWDGSTIFKLKCNFEYVREARDYPGERDADWTCLAGDMIIVCDV